MNFEEKTKSIDINNLKSFLESQTKPCYESELLNQTFKDFIIRTSEPLELYQNHFALFHILYKLQNEYYKHNKYLHVHFMRTFLSEYPADGLCRHYDDHSGTFCKENTLDPNEIYCPFHKKKNEENQLEVLSVKYFYLDKTNYDLIDENTAEDFINGTWEVLKNFKKFENSFKVLDLSLNSPIEVIKKQFKVLAKKYHPDISEQNHEKFVEINNAYRYIIDRVKKMQYK